MIMGALHMCGVFFIPSDAVTRGGLVIMCFVLSGKSCARCISCLLYQTHSFDKNRGVPGKEA